MTALKPSHLQSLYAQKLSEGLSKRTVQYIHAVLRRASGFAVKWDLIARNPTNGVQAPSPEKKAPETLSVEQRNQVMEAGKDHCWRCIYLIGIGCGLRLGEITGLKKQDYDPVNQVVNYIAGKRPSFNPSFKWNKSQNCPRSIRT